MTRLPAWRKGAVGVRLNPAAAAGALTAQQKNARLTPKPTVRRKAALGASVPAVLPQAAGAPTAVLTAQQPTKKLNVLMPTVNGV